MKKEMITLLEALSNADGVAGREAEVRAVLQDYLINPKIKQTIDPYGNLYAKVHQENKKEIILIAHMDEVGFLVKHIDDHGFIYIEPLGGWSNTVLPAQLVRITARKNGTKHIGVFGTTFPTSEIPVIKKMFIDIGVHSKQAVENLGIEIGDMVTPYTKAEMLGNQTETILGKAWDDRSQCAVLAKTIKELTTHTLGNYQVTGIASVQEEVGTRGSKVARHHVTPTFAIILDVATAKDTPQADFYRNRELGKGPGIVLYDKTALSTIEFADFVRDVAREQGIPFQYDMLSGGGTDAGSIQHGMDAVPTVTLSLGVRYCHSGSSIVNIDDILATVELLVAVIKKIDKAGLELGNV